MIHKICFFLLMLPLTLFGYQYELSICAIFQNEAEWLREWIEYHRLVGVQHFWLYNNNSTDHYKSVLRPYVQEGIVNLIEWPSPPDQDWTPYQQQAYMDCLRNMRYRTKWLALIDVDEFIVPKTADTITKMLEPFESRENVGGVMLFWQMFGTSGVWKIPRGKTMVQTLLQKARWDNGNNRLFKTICRPECVRRCNVHFCDYLPPYKGMSMNGKGDFKQPICIEGMCIHHYWMRTEKFFYETKLERRRRYSGREYSELEIQRMMKNLNAVRDESILRFVPALRKRMCFRR